MEQQKEDLHDNSGIWGPAGSEGPGRCRRVAGRGHWTFPTATGGGMSPSSMALPFPDGGQQVFEVSGRRCERGLGRSLELGAGGSGEDLVTSCLPTHLKPRP